MIGWINPPSAFKLAVEKDSYVIINWKLLKVRDHSSFFSASPIAMSSVNICCIISEIYVVKFDQYQKSSSLIY